MATQPKEPPENLAQAGRRIQLLPEPLGNLAQAESRIQLLPGPPGTQTQTKDGRVPIETTSNKAKVRNAI